MDKKTQPLFKEGKLALGYHNVGSNGVLRAGSEAIANAIEKHYGQRCGHIPMNSEQAGVLVQSPTEETISQIAYLSELCGKEIKIYTPDEVKKVSQTAQPLIVPYINVSNTETYLQQLGATSWGMPGPMTDILKNKADFYQLVDELALEGFDRPEYCTVEIENVAFETKKFLKKISETYDQVGISNHYPLGVMIRAAESDGNYGCALAYEKQGIILVVPNGDSYNAENFSNWDEALEFSQKAVKDTMNPQIEHRVVISRYIDLEDSPGMSVIMLDGAVASLGWNGQLQKEGSKACIGTSSYKPKNQYLANLQKETEDQTAELFEKFLRKTAEKCGIDFASFKGLANLDIMIPTALEKHVQEKLGKKNQFYFAECNARWTNYTDAIMAMINIQRKQPTIQSMQQVIAKGIYTIDKFNLPDNIDPLQVRTRIFQTDQQLQKEGTRIICRMAKSPMGLIFAGDINRAEKEMNDLVTNMI